MRTIGVAIENVKKGVVTSYGSASSLEAASTEKLLSAITYSHLVEKGVLSLNDKIRHLPSSVPAKANDKPKR